MEAVDPSRKRRAGKRRGGPSAVPVNPKPKGARMAPNKAALDPKGVCQGAKEGSVTSSHLVGFCFIEGLTRI